MTPSFIINEMNNLKFKGVVPTKQNSQFLIIFLIMIILAAFIDQMIHLRDSMSMYDPNALNQDPTTLWAERLERIKNDLPVIGVVGYLSEMDYPGLKYDIIDADEEFVMTQYTLTPLILDRGSSEHDYIIANIVGEGPFDFEEVFGLRVVNEYGFGIYLLEPIP